MYCQKNTSCLRKIVEYDKYCFKSKEKPKYLKKKIVIVQGVEKKQKVQT